MREAGWQDFKSKVRTVEKRLFRQWRPAMFAKIDKRQWMERLRCEPGNVAIGDCGRLKLSRAAQREASG
jgi:hypothetical protein